MSLAAAVGILLDQLTKALAVDAVSAGGPIEIVGRLRLTLIANRGVVGGLPIPPWIVVLAMIGMLVLGVRRFADSPAAARIAFAAALGGGIGNLIDRALHRPAFPDHAVVDWISIRGFATFNLADVLIIGGGVVFYLALQRSGASGPAAVGAAGSRAC